LSDHRNMILAIVLSMIVLLGWNLVAERFFPTANPPSTKIEDGKARPLPPGPGQGSPAGAPSVVTGAPSPAQPTVRSVEAVRAATPRVAIESPRLSGSINLVGARIDDLVLTTHRETIAANARPVRLFAPSGSPRAYFASFGWTDTGPSYPSPATRWNASGTRLTPATPITLWWDNATGQRFEIRLSIDEGYMFGVEHKVTNRGGGAVAARPFALVSRADKSRDSDSWTYHVGPVGVFNDAANYDWSFDKLSEEGSQRFSTTGGWIGFTDQYWLTAVIPDQRIAVDAGFESAAGQGFQAVAAPAPAIVGPGQASTYRSRLFAGAKEIALLDLYEEQGVARLDKAIDWGWFEWFMKPIFTLLNWLFASLGNFGVAIICLTLIVRLIMFPIAQKQFASMAGMRVLQPKMKVLQEKYADDKPKLQQEMLKLYQEEKVNPMAGCLPILIQIPIFYALYKVLLVAVEMRHKPFALWIEDLAAPDPLTPVNLFGFLPFTPPSFLALGVLPILLGVTMWLQFKLNPPPTDPVQKQVFAFMPWILMFVMAPFAAGLQLYWTVNNVLTIAQQKWLYSRHPGMKAAPEPA